MSAGLILAEAPKRAIQRFPGLTTSVRMTNGQTGAKTKKHFKICSISPCVTDQPDVVVRITERNSARCRTL